MIIISITGNKFYYNNDNNDTIKTNFTSETINKLIQYCDSDDNNPIFQTIDIEFIKLLILLNEKKY